MLLYSIKIFSVLKFFLLLPLVFLVNIQNLYSQSFSSTEDSLPQKSKNLVLEPLQVGKGREVNLIYDILQDQFGFMWFGTFNGVVRYDGNKITHFEPDPEDSTSLQSKLIYKLMEDPSGNIWALSGEGRIHVYLPHKDYFQPINDLKGDSLLRRSFLATEIIVADSFGNVWLAENNGLLKFQKQKDRNEFIVQRYGINSSDNTSKSDLIYTIFLASNQNIWLGTEKGLAYYDPLTNQIRIVPSTIDIPINHLIETQSGTLVLGTLKNGLYLFDPKEESISQLTESKKLDPNKRNLYKSMVKDGKDNIWFLAGDWDSQTYSLQKLNPVTGNFQSYLSPFTPQGTMGRNNIKLEVSPEGSIWVISGRGLIQFDPFKEEFINYNNKDFFEDWSILNDLYFDKTGVMWFGTFSEGIYKHAPSTSKFEIIIPPEKSSKKQASFISLPVYIDSRGFLWSGNYYGTNRYTFDENNQLQKIEEYSFISSELRENKKGELFITTNGGLKCFDLNTGKFRENPSLPFQLKPPFTLSLLEEENFWFNTFGDGLYHFNSAKKEWIHFQHNKDEIGSISTNFLNPETLLDRDGEIWVSSLAGLNHYKPESGTFDVYLDQVEVMHMHEDKNGVFWISSNGQGLFRFDKKDFSYKRFYSKTGYPFRTLFSILEDDRGGLWIPSDIGLFWFDPKTENFQWFDVFDGIPAEYFAQSMSSKRKNGEMFFPLLNGGFLRFHPDSLQLDEHPSNPVILNLRLLSNEESQLPSKPLWMTDYIVLRHDQNVFSLEYTATHFAAPENNHFAYMLEGVDKDWNEVGSTRIVNFAGLDPGNYTFKVKATNHDGVWSKKISTLKIKILPPWWLSWWAIFIYVICSGFFLFAVYIFLNRRWALKNKLSLEQREAERLKDLNDHKNKFYTNITHEFRTPLTIILGMANELKKAGNKNVEKFKNGLDMISRNGSHLLELVNQMLRLSKLEAGLIPLKMVQEDVVVLIKYVIESFHSLAEVKNIDLGFQSSVEEIIMDHDPEKLREIISNLLSNAIKFTPSGGKISTIVSVKRNSFLSELTIKVKDTGVGIPKENIPYIFDRFYSDSELAPNQLDNTGIGLALTKELVKLMKGRIDVKSEVGKGSEFAIIFPINTKSLSKTNTIQKAVSRKPPIKRQVFIDEKENFNVAEHKHEKPLVLVIEDNKDVIKYLCLCLEKKYQIEVAQNGKEGFEKAIEKVPDIVISDVMIPLINGFDLCHKLKQDFRTSHIPIIMLTAKADLTSRIEGLEKGADAYLTKPFSKDELLIRLKKLTELRKQLHKYYAALSVGSDSEDAHKVSSAVEDTFIQSVRAILIANLDNENFDISNLCKEMGMSRAQLYRKFKALTDQPVGNLLRSMRLQKAKDLLQSTDLQIAEVAYQVGFKDPAYFTRSFKQEFGKNPTNFRKY